MLHDIPVRQKNMDQHWLDEVERLIKGIAAMNLKVVPLETLIDRPVMADSDMTVTSPNEPQKHSAH